MDVLPIEDTAMLSTRRLTEYLLLCELTSISNNGYVAEMPIRRVQLNVCSFREWLSGGSIWLSGARPPTVGLGEGSY